MRTLPRRILLSAMLVACVAAAQSHPFADSVGRDFARCVRSCVHIKMECTTECRAACQDLDPEPRGQCLSECRQVCSDNEDVCKEECQAIKDGETPETP